MIPIVLPNSVQFAWSMGHGGRICRSAINSPVAASKVRTRFWVEAVKTIWRPVEGRVWISGRAQCYLLVSKDKMLGCRCEFAFSSGMNDAFHSCLNCETLSGSMLWSPPRYDDWPISASRGESEGAAAFANGAQIQGSTTAKRSLEIKCMLAVVHSLHLW